AIVSAHEAKATSWSGELLEASGSMRESFRKARRNKNRSPSREDCVFLGRFKGANQAAFFGFSTRLTQLAADLPATPDSIPMKPQMGMQEWEALCRIIGCSAELSKKMVDPIEMIRRPLVVLTGGRVLCGAPNHALDQLRDAFEEAAS